MKIQEAHRQFNLFLDKVSTEVTPEFSHKQIDIFIHEAEVRLVKQAYGQNNIYKKGYQEIQKRTDDLNTLVKTGYLTYNISSIDGIYSFGLDNIFVTETMEANMEDDYMFFIKAMVKVSSSTVASTYTGISLIPQDKYTEVIKDPFNKSRISEPNAFFEDNAIKVDSNSGSFTPSMIKLTYLCYPRQVVWKTDADLSAVDSILPEQKQREAIQLAVAIALESVESARTNSSLSMLNTQE